MASQRTSTSSQRPVRSRAGGPASREESHTPIDAAAIVRKLRSMGSEKVRDGMARFAITTDRAFGIPVGDLRTLAKSLRAIGARRPTLKPAVFEIAGRFADSPGTARRWIGKDVLRDLNKKREQTHGVQPL